MTFGPLSSKRKLRTALYSFYSQQTKLDFDTERLSTLSTVNTLSTYSILDSCWTAFAHGVAVLFKCGVEGDLWPNTTQRIAIKQSIATNLLLIQSSNAPKEMSLKNTENQTPSSTSFSHWRSQTVCGQHSYIHRESIRILYEMFSFNSVLVTVPTVLLETSAGLEF